MSGENSEKITATEQKNIEGFFCNGPFSIVPNKGRKVDNTVIQQ